MVQNLFVCTSNPIFDCTPYDSSKRHHPSSVELGREDFHDETVRKLTTTSPRNEKCMNIHNRNEDECEIELQSLQEHRFRIRCFTPLVELYQCSHGTLAAAHSLWEMNIVNPNSSRIIFETQKK